jgi:peptidoglycan/xylan/chitin deacetylase (PgdA/CDA1 family)
MCTMRSRLRRFASAHPRAAAGAAFLTRWAIAALGLVLLFTCLDDVVHTTSGDTRPAAVSAPAPYPCTGYVALTIDDGPEPYTDSLARVLRAQGLHATFFLIGREVERHPQQARDLVAAGFAVENHTYGHRDVTGLGDAAIDAEIARGSAAIEQVTGQEPTLFRPPEGATNDAVRVLAADHGMTEVIWTTDTKDWEAGRTAREIADTALRVPAGGIVLLHDFDNAASRDALPLIAAGLRQRGLCTGRVVPSPTPVTAWEGLTYNAAAAAW